MMSRKRIYEILELAEPGDKSSRIFDISIITLIALNVVALIAESVDSIDRDIGGVLFHFEVISIGIFSCEYIFRVWSSVENPKFSNHQFKRLYFIITPLALVDFLAIIPFYLPFIILDLRFLRMIRMVRIIRMAKVGRYSESVKVINRVLLNKKEELFTTLFILIILLIFSSTLMYYAENEEQPDKFPNIPETMWWSVVTLTTVGYGDVYPITTSGKILGAVIALLGIGMFALPTAIIGAGFMEEMINRKQTTSICPHCGMNITEAMNETGHDR